MAENNTKKRFSRTVRIWPEPKERLQKVQRRMADKEGREVTEAELVSKAVAAFCKREEPKLGITV
jgi:hypothetical protein